MGQIMKSGIPYGGGGGGSIYTAGDGIVIDNDEISTDNMSAEDMAEIVTPLPSVMSRRMKYSTEEQLVGEWIDGKHVYQKTVHLTSLNATWAEVAHNIVNINQVCNINGVVGDNTAMFATGGCVSNEYERIFFQVTATHVKCYVAGNNSLVNKPVYVTIQYTKTTD